MTTLNVNTVTELIAKEIPSTCFLSVIERKNVLGGGSYLRIFFAANDHNINNVQGQKPQAVSLSLDLQTLELETQIFGGNGGGCIYRKVNQDDPSEKYLAMKRIKIPFRKPQKTEIAVTKAITKFAQNWVKIIKENKDVLMYQNLVDYSKF